MTDFTIHTVETAPEAAKPILEGAEKGLGFVPNLYATMAQSPELLKAYTQLAAAIEANSLSVNERTVVWQTINVAAECHYCVPAHTAVGKMQGADDSITASIRAGTPLEDRKLEALRVFTQHMYDSRGSVTEEQLQALFAAGYDNTTVLDVILGLSHKTISNYTNQIAKTPIDAAFASFV